MENKSKLWWSLGAGALVIVAIAVIVLVNGQPIQLAGSGGAASQCFYLDEYGEPVYYQCEEEQAPPDQVAPTATTESASNDTRSALPGCPYTIDFVAEPCGKCASKSVVGHDWDPDGTSCVVQAEARGEGATVCFPGLGAIHYAENEAGRLAGKYTLMSSGYASGETCVTITGSTLPEFFVAFVKSE